MKITACILILSVGLFAQTHGASWEGNNVFTGANTFSGPFNLISLSNGCLFVASGLVSSQTCGGITGATANGGLVATGTTLGMRLDCTNNQVLQWNTTAWGCATIAGSGTVTGTGTTNYIPLWTSTTAIGASGLQLAGGVLTYSGDLTFTGTNSGSTNGTIIIRGATSLGTTAGGSVQLAGGPGSGAISGGSVTISGGNSGGTAGSFGGGITIQGGSAPGGAGSSLYQPTLLLNANGSGPSLTMKDDNVSNGRIIFQNSAAVGITWRTGSGVPSFNCGGPTVYFRSDAPDVSDFLYLCVSGTSWTAITVP